METKIKVAAAHAAPVFMDKKATTRKVVSLIEQAGKEGVKFLVFPETFIPGFPYFINCYPPLTQVTALTKYAEESVVVDDSSAEIASIRSACRAARVAISLGISERMSGGHTLFNSQVNIDADGTLLGVHRKIQPTYAERAVWAQGSGHTLRTYPFRRIAGGGDSRDRDAVVNVGGLCCWEHTINGARQALIVQKQQIHAGAWPALSTMAGFEAVADTQIEALMKNHALTAQVFVVTASSWVDEGCLAWMEENMGKQELVKLGGGWSSVIHPFCAYLAGPHTGPEEKLLTAEVDLAQLASVKVFVDAAGHYQRPEIFKFQLDSRPMWADDEKIAGPAAAVSHVNEDADDTTPVDPKQRRESQ